jgi:hypothetical protein
MNYDAKPDTVAVITTLAKLYQVVVTHRSYRKSIGQFTRGTLDAAREVFNDLPHPMQTLRTVASLAKVGWGAEDCCRLTIAALKKARREHCKSLVETPVSDTADTGDDTPARQLWRSITTMVRPFTILPRMGSQRSWLARRGHWPPRSDRKSRTAGRHRPW